MRLSPDLCGSHGGLEGGDACRPNRPRQLGGGPSWGEASPTENGASGGPAPTCGCPPRLPTADPSAVGHPRRRGKSPIRWGQLLESSSRPKSTSVRSRDDGNPVGFVRLMFGVITTMANDSNLPPHQVEDKTLRCEDCDGWGEVRHPDPYIYDNVTCDNCDGSGYRPSQATLAQREACAKQREHRSTIAWLIFGLVAVVAFGLLTLFLCIAADRRGR